MADNANGRDENGTKDRATVALVDAKVDGLKYYLQSEFANIKEDVRALAAVVADVIKQGVQIEDHERRLEAIEKSQKDAREYRRGQLPVIVLGGVTAIGVIVTIVTQIH